MFTKYDDVTASLLPADAVACSYYADSRWANLNAVRARCPHAKLLPVLALRGVVPPLKQLVGWENGVQIDIENTDWTPADAANFAKGCLANGVTPHFYMSLSDTPAVVNTCHAAGIDRSQYKLNVAHWTFQPHICTGIATAIGPVSADATQYTDRAFGVSLDASLCLDDFFGPTNQPTHKSPHGVEKFEGWFDYASGHWGVTRQRSPRSLIYSQKPRDAYAQVHIQMQGGDISIKPGK